MTPRRALFPAAAALLAAPALAQPARPVRVVIASAPGGGTDLLARLFCERASARLGTAFVPDNRPGAGGNLASEAVARSAPDGTTLLVHHDGFAANAGLFARLPYDPVRDFAPVTLLARSTQVFGAGAAAGLDGLPALLARLRAAPGSLAYASCGAGTAQHLAGEMLKAAARVDMPHLAYRGCAPALADVLAGSVPVFVQSLGNVEAAARENRVRLLAVASPARHPAWPALPTVAEAGFPGFELHPWYGVLAPAGTPAALLENCAAAWAAALEEPEVQARLARLRFDPDPAGPARFGEILRADVGRLVALIRAAGITLD